MKCRHCKREALYRAKGLCCTCYKDKSIRNRYQSQSKFSPDNFKKIDDEASRTVPENSQATNTRFILRRPSRSGKRTSGTGTTSPEMTLEQLDAMIAEQRKTMIGEPKYPQSRPWTPPVVKVVKGR